MSGFTIHASACPYAHLQLLIPNAKMVAHKTKNIDIGGGEIKIQHQFKKIKISPSPKKL